MSSSSEVLAESKTNIYIWLLEYMCHELHKEFLESSTVDSSSDRDYLKGFIQHLAPMTPLPSIKMCMIQYLYLLVRLVDGPSIAMEFKSAQCSGRGDENIPITPLEDAIQILDKIKIYDEHKHILKNDIDEFKELLRTEAVFVCCRGKDFEKGKQVLERQWPENSIKTEIDRMTKTKLLDIVDSRRCTHVDLRKNSYADFIAKTHHYLQTIYSVFPESFLIAADRKLRRLVVNRQSDGAEGDSTIESLEDVAPTPKRSARKTPRKKLRRSPRNEQPKENENEECDQESDELFLRVLEYSGKDPEKVVMEISREGFDTEVVNKLKQYVPAQSEVTVTEQENSYSSSDSEIFACKHLQNASPNGSSSSEIPHKCTDERTCLISSEIPHKPTDKTTHPLFSGSDTEAFFSGSDTEAFTSSSPHKSTDQPRPRTSSSPHKSTDQPRPRTSGSPHKSTDQPRPRTSGSPHKSTDQPRPRTSSSPHKSTDQPRLRHAKHRTTKVSLKFTGNEDEGEIVKWDSDDDEVAYPELRTPKCRHSLDLKQSCRRRWTDHEIQELLAGVRKFGDGQWSKIRDHFDFEHRSAVDIKDKWRNLNKNNKR